MGDLRGIILDRLVGSSQCYGHCQEATELRFLKGEAGDVGALVCPSGYVSRLISYGLDVDANELESLVTRKAGGALPVKGGDIRMATRYSLDLGLGGPHRKVLREAYWTQNYGKSKSKEPDRAALFMCSSCGKLLVQPATAKTALCGECAP